MEWIGEDNNRLGIKFLLRAKPIAKRKSKFNWNIIVAENKTFGKFLVLGDEKELTLQVAERYDFYSEMLVHVPLSLCKNLDRVLVIGGGDGSVTREIFKHPVKHVDLVEIDSEVVSIARSILKIDNGSLERVNIHFEDGATYIRRVKEPYDVVICDITDPYPDNPAGSLASERFFESLSRATRGIAVIQSGSPVFQSDVLSRLYKFAKKTFSTVRVYLGPMPIYPGGLWSYLLMMNRNIDPTTPVRKVRALYYSPDTHLGAFMIPPFVKRIIE